MMVLGSAVVMVNGASAGCPTIEVQPVSHVHTHDATDSEILDQSHISEDGHENCGDDPTATCGNCGGIGDVPCSACGGTGDEMCMSCSGWGGCGDCGGGGYGTCTNCGGTGDGTCTDCGGSGDGPCSFCAGSGMCSMCGGDGDDGGGPGSCMDCAGTGTCNNCGGSGMEAGMCPTCGGSGVEVGMCPICGGSGMEAGMCFTCGGSGSVTCFTCGGSGMEAGMCPTCGGSGDCMGCGGTGYVPCFSCGGSTTETCADCGGIGTVFESYQLAQTFTPGYTADLTRIRVNIADANSFGSDVYFAIYDTSLGEPNAQISSQESLNGAVVGATMEWCDIPFSTQPALISGGLYAIVISADEYDWNWQRHSMGSYPGGQAWTSEDSGATWAPSSAMDFVFETYMLLNSNPIANSDNYTTPEGTALIESAPGVLGNDTDQDVLDTLSVVAVNGAPATIDANITLTSGAILNQSDDGSFVYDPNGAFEYLGAGAWQVDSYVYTIYDNNGSFDNATFTDL